MSEFFMDYVIFIKDDLEYQAAIDYAGSNFIKASPRAAATQFGIPYPYPTGNINTIGKGIYFLFPYIPGQPIELPDSIGQVYNDNIPSTVYPVQPGNPSGPFFETVPNVILSWVGNIVKAGYARHFAPLTVRRWIGGKELAGVFEGGSGIDYQNFCRDYSRTIDGYGFGIRGNSAAGVWNRKVDEYQVGLDTRNSWERFYVRFRNPPSNIDTGLWRTHGSPFTNAGVGLKWKTSGGVDLYSIDAINGQTDEGEVFEPILNEWYRVDILLTYGTGLLNTGKIKIYINGVFRFEYTDTLTSSLSTSTKHVSSDLGLWTATSDTEVEVDFDDWFNSNLPTNLNPASLDFLNDNYAVDWQTGSHVKVHFAQNYFQGYAFGAPTGPIPPWIPAGQALGTLNTHPAPNRILGTAELQATGAQGTIVSTSDMLDQATHDNVIPHLGLTGALGSIVSRNNLGNNGKIGFIWALGRPNQNAVYEEFDQKTVDSPFSFAFFPGTGVPVGTGIGATLVPEEWAPFETVHVKSNDNNSTGTLSMLMLVAEYIGLWNKEDDPAFNFPISRLTNLHNCRWNNTAWGYVGAQPVPDVFAVGGIYAGNGGYQEYNLPGPCHFMWIRTNTVPHATLPGIKFFGASVGGHFSAYDTISSGFRTYFDPVSKNYRFTIFGEEMNEPGVQYQFVAFCDPGMRYNLCGAFRHGATSSVPRANPLVIPDFIPEAAFMQLDKTIGPSDATSGGNDGLWYKDIQFPGNNGIALASNTILNNFINFGTGLFNSYSGIHKAEGPINYSLWRTHDGGDGSNVMVQLTSYVGDSSNLRDITLTPASGRFPLLVCVFPNASAGPAFMRDPSHQGEFSSYINNNVLQIDAIKGVGIDKITVGAWCNSGGVSYSVFSICGGLKNENGIYHPTYHSNSNILPYVLPTLPIQVEKSGIYFINSNKASAHDSYYNNAELKIPDPTVRTALFGD